jgi:hypothetical protein
MEVLMAELSADEEQSLDDALSTLDDLYEATLKPDDGFHSEQMAALAKLAEEAMGCVLSVLDPDMYDAVQRDCPEKNWGAKLGPSGPSRCSMKHRRNQRVSALRLTLPICCVAASVSTSLLLCH